jgi:hypothetical protein
MGSKRRMSRATVISRRRRAASMQPVEEYVLVERYKIDSSIVYDCDETELNILLGEFGEMEPIFDKSKNFSLYVNESEREECGWIRDIYVDEGFQQDCLMTGGNVGLNRPWMEMCNMNDVLELIARRLDPDWSPEPSPYIGRGWSARHYHKQYIEIIDRLGCDNELFALQFEWPKPDLPEEPPACNQTATVV